MDRRTRAEVPLPATPLTLKPLPARASAGQVVAGILAGVEHLVANRPRAVTEISERHHEPWNQAAGLTVEGLDEPMDRPEPPDRSGARI